MNCYEMLVDGEIVRKFSDNEFWVDGIYYKSDYRITAIDDLHFQDQPLATIANDECCCESDDDPMADWHVGGGARLYPSDYKRGPALEINPDYI